MSIQLTRASNPDTVGYRTVVAVRRRDDGDKEVRFPSAPEPTLMGMTNELAGAIGAPTPSIERPSTLDFLVAASGACMAATFARALVKRGADVPSTAHEVQAVGDVVVDHGVPILRSITVRHTINAPVELWATIKQVHGTYQRSCAVSRSLAGAIEMRSELELMHS